jgi:phenylalanyl-tRNA synthetase alpha subunit
MEPLIIAILIGLITTIFNKVKESPSKKPVRQKPIQTASPASSQPERRGRETERERMRRREPKREPVKEAASSIQTRFEDKKKETESNYASLQKKEERYSRKLEAHQTRARKIREGDHPLTIDFKNEDDIVKGFIFSEVFGPPRSKKGHHQK